MATGANIQLPARAENLRQGFAPRICAKNSRHALKQRPGAWFPDIAA
jgi:hypothetical protein